MKITAKTTKEQMKAFLEENILAVTDENLGDRVAYALKVNDDKITRKDLADLVREVVKNLGEAPTKAPETEELTPVEPKAENSVKKLTKGVSKKQEIEVPEEPKSEETTAEDNEVEADEAPKKEEDKPKKKLGGKKDKPNKKDGVTATETSKKSVQLASMFPKTLEVGDSKYELAEDIKTLEDLYSALGKDEEIVFAYYWTKRHLKQFPYFGGWLGQPKSFDNDLDLATAIYVSDEKKVSYQVSMYTEAIYTILPTDLEEVDGIRMAGGIEYQIYRAVV